jgi:dihydrofolate synthase/folylpolyglutamate synthase
MDDTLAYGDALGYIYGFTDYEKRGFAAYRPEFYDLDRVRHLLALLGNPQQAFQSVHIAGTKGKGSTAAMVESILRAAGYRTGLYTSPHLHTFRERIQAGGELISEADVTRMVGDMQSLVAQVPEITTFEVMTALAFAWFAEQGVEYAVLEVGLGGRLDATNVIVPEVAVITSISYDHTAILGDTLSLIAAEKAGIVKPGVPVVSAPQAAEALAVIEAVCHQSQAPLMLVGRDWTWELGEARGGLEGQAFAVRRGSKVWQGLWIPLLGEHQVVNATTALATLWLLREAGVRMPEAAMRRGLRSLQWPGRIEILGRAPLVVADSAHNGDSAKKLVAALQAHCDFRRLIVVWGASADHATPELIEALLAEADRAIAARTQHPRAADPAWLQAQAAVLGFQVEMAPSVAQALVLALDGAGPDDLICCTGSVFVAAEARAAWFALQGLSAPPSDQA